MPAAIYPRLDTQGVSSASPVVTAAGRAGDGSAEALAVARWCWSRGNLLADLAAPAIRVPARRGYGVASTRCRYTQPDPLRGGSSRARTAPGAYRQRLPSRPCSRRLRRLRRARIYLIALLFAPGVGGEPRPQQNPAHVPYRIRPGIDSLDSSGRRVLIRRSAADPDAPFVAHRDKRRTTAVGPQIRYTAAFRVVAHAGPDHALGREALVDQRGRPPGTRGPQRTVRADPNRLSPITRATGIEVPPSRVIGAGRTPRLPRPIPHHICPCSLIRQNDSGNSGQSCASAN